MHPILLSILDDAIPFITAVVAIVVSVLSYQRTSRYSRLLTTQQHIQTIYREFSDFNKLRFENPLYSHLFELPLHYFYVKTTISQYASKLTPAKRVEYIMRERALAILIFSSYESHLYSLQISEEQKNNRQKVFLDEVLAYMENHWLRNPRLLYFWNSVDHQLNAMFESSTRTRFQENVLSKIGGATKDEVGPAG